jgi:hypothetical protein
MRKLEVLSTAPYYQLEQTILRIKMFTIKNKT